MHLYTNGHYDHPEIAVRRHFPFLSLRINISFHVLPELEITSTPLCLKFSLSKVTIRNFRGANVISIFNEIHYFHLTLVFGVHFFFLISIVSGIKICIRIIDEMMAKS